MTTAVPLTDEEAKGLGGWLERGAPQGPKTFSPPPAPSAPAPAAPPASNDPPAPKTDQSATPSFFQPQDEESGFFGGAKQVVRGLARGVASDIPEFMRPQAVDEFAKDPGRSGLESGAKFVGEWGTIVGAPELIPEKLGMMLGGRLAAKTYDFLTSNAGLSSISKFLTPVMGQATANNVTPRIANAIIGTGKNVADFAALARSKAAQAVTSETAMRAVSGVLTPVVGRRLANDVYPKLINHIYDNAGGLVHAAQKGALAGALANPKDPLRGAVAGGVAGPAASEVASGARAGWQAMPSWAKLGGTLVGMEGVREMAGGQHGSYLPWWLTHGAVVGLPALAAAALGRPSLAGGVAGRAAGEGGGGNQSGPFENQ